MHLDKEATEFTNKVWQSLAITDDSFNQMLVDYALSKLFENPKAKRFVEEMEYVPKLSEKLELLKIATRITSDGEIHIKPYNPLINSKIRFLEAKCPENVDYYNELNGCSSAALDALKAYRNMSGATTFGNSVSYIFALDKRTRPLHKALEAITDKDLKSRAARQLFGDDYGFVKKSLFQEILDGKETVFEQSAFYKEHQAIAKPLYEAYAKLKNSSYFFFYPSDFRTMSNRYEAYDAEPGFGKRCHRTADQITSPFAKYLVKHLCENEMTGAYFSEKSAHSDTGKKFLCAILKFDKEYGFSQRRYNDQERWSLYRAITYPIKKENEIMHNISYALFDIARVPEKAVLNINLCSFQEKIRQ